MANQGWRIFPDPATDEYVFRRQDGNETRLPLTDLSAHLADTSDAHDASAVSSVPAGTLASTNVQDALNELDGEKSPTGHTHSGLPVLGNVSGPASYPTGGFVLDLSGTFATALTGLFLQLEVEDSDLPPHQLVVTRDSPSAGQATIKVMRARYDKTTDIGGVTNQPGGVTVQAASGATTATEAAHTHPVDLPNFTGNTGANQSAPINPTAGVAGTAADDATHTHTLDHDHGSVSSAAGSAHAHVDDNIYEHDHSQTHTETNLVYVELPNGTNISTAVWRYLATGS